MALAITKRWMQIRIEEDDARATLYASADDGDKSATGSWPVELPKQLVKDLQKAIADHAGAVEAEAMGALYESRKIDAGEAPPEGVKAIKLDGGLGMKGETTRRKD